MPRPRRAATKAFASPPPDPDADPDFLALSKRQQDRIDRAFARALGLGSSKKRKRDDEATAPKSVDEGRFVDDGGGFMVDDEMDAGGFVPDDDADAGGFIADDDEAGGFLPDEEGSPGVSDARGVPINEDRIPFRLIPSLLNSLGLPSDEDVIGVFKASATGWSEGNSKQKSGAAAAPDELGVGKKDWRAVCAALMGPEDEAAGDKSSSSGEDVFELQEESDDSLSALSTPSADSGGVSKAKGGKRKGRGKNKDLEEGERIKLTSRQREMVTELWKMVKPPSEVRRPGDNVLGREEVKVLVRSLGEMWTEDEITEMVTLFSTQHQGRGLSYDDFGTVMFRAGLV